MTTRATVTAAVTLRSVLPVVFLRAAQYDTITGRGPVTLEAPVDPDDGNRIAATPQALGKLAERAVHGKRPVCRACRSRLLPWADRCHCGGRAILPSPKHRADEPRPQGRHRAGGPWVTPW